MKHSSQLLATALAVATWAGAAYGGDQFFNMDSDPTGDPGWLITGNNRLEAWQAFDGNPASGGYIQITPSIDSRACVIAFPDVDLYTNSFGEVIVMPVKAFRIEADFRVGNGSRRPADGFSISFCRDGDQVLRNATNNAVNGFAGGDSLDAANAAAGSSNAENGTKTGLAVLFDAWEGNWLPTNGVIGAFRNGGGTTDREGITIRVDDSTLDVNVLNNRNGNCQSPTNAACAAASAAAIDSLQTGPWTGDSSCAGDGCDSDGSYNNLTWQRLTMELTTNRVVTVTWKGNTLVSTQLAAYPAHVGRLVLAGRTGGNNQHTHVDNIHIVTVPSVQPVFQRVVALTNGFRAIFQNVASAVLTNFHFVTLDGANITAAFQLTPVGVDAYTHGAFIAPTNFIPRSSHTLVMGYTDALGNRYTNTATVNTPAWFALPGASALPLASIDTTKPGMKAKSYQTRWYQPNQLRWTEEQVIGLRGPNVADQGGATGGYFNYEGPMDLANGTGAGFFTVNNPWSAFGIPAPGGFYATEDNSTVEFFGYIYFPTSGVYRSIITSDDGYRLTIGNNPLDRMGREIAWFDGGRGVAATPPTDPSTDFVYIDVPQAGAYPVRLLYENGGGGAGLEWYFVNGDPTNATYALVNDTSNPESLMLYREASAQVEGAYVRKANPVRDARNVVFYQPIVVELGDGDGTKTVNTASVALSVDGIAQQLTVNKSGDTTRIVSQMGTNLWTVGAHTNLLTFQDAAGNSYSYSWPFTVINVPTNRVVALPANMGVPSGSVVASERGFRVRSYQSPMDNPNHLSWTEQQIQGHRGFNVTDQGATNAQGFFTFNGESDNGILDLRYSSGTGAGGEWSWQNSLTLFGIGARQEYRFNIPANLAESSALEVGAWLVFPAAGYYILHANSDDGVKLTAPYGSPFGKLGILLAEDNVGRGVAGGSGEMVGGSYAAVYVPAAGAYPFRILYENGGTDGGIEFSAYVMQADGGIAKVAVNDLSDPTSIKAYQRVSGEPVAPYISYANPVHNQQDVVFWQPIVVDITDGTGNRTVTANTINLTVDGLPQAVTVTKSGAVTHLVSQMAGKTWLPGAHTNVLTFTDGAGTAYTYTWPFTVINFAPYGVVTIPASNAVPIASIDRTKPGFRVYPYQTSTSGTDPGTSIANFESQQLGGFGANIAVVPPEGYYVWNDVTDIGDGYNHIGYATDAARGEYRYNYSFDRLGLVSNGGGLNTNRASLIFAGYLEFTQAGTYAMTVNSDDGFKVTAPFNNPRNQQGQMLGWVDGGRGVTTGAGFGPRGSITHFAFNVPAPGAYPIRLLWFNGGGGLDIEWTIYQYLPDGSVARLLVNDENTPGSIRAWQTTTQTGPYIQNMSPTLPLVAGQIENSTITLNRGANLTIDLRDDSTTVDLSSIKLNYMGVDQPLVITQPSAGVTRVMRYGTNALPTGAYGPAILTYKDNTGKTYTTKWTVISGQFAGTARNGFPLGVGDAAKPGFLMRNFQIDPYGTVTMPTRIGVAEQVLAGIWTNVNSARLTNTENGYFLLNGTGPQNGIVNFNVTAPQAAGNFGTNNGYGDRLFPGIPGTVFSGQGNNSFVSEVLTYVEFPTNGIYTMGVNSDDGFRVTSGWTPAANNGALIVHGSSAVAGMKAAAPPSMASRLLTNNITGQLVQALGTGYGSTVPAEACNISNPSALAGKIALVYRGTCGFVQKVEAAAAAGAIGVIIAQDRPVVTAGDGWFPTELGVTPVQSIPAIMIKRSDADALVAAMATNAITVTMTAIDDLVNPGANSPVLGQADLGKGTSDVLFDVNVPQAGVYPIRLLYFQGGGGGALEWFSMVGNNRVLINDATSTNGPALKAFQRVTVVQPTIQLARDGQDIILTFTGTLQMTTDLTLPFADVPGTSPLRVRTDDAKSKFFRTR